MSAMEPLCKLLGIDPKKLTKEENLLIESTLYSHLYNELIENYRKANIEFFQTLRFNIEMENQMLYENLTRSIMNDVLLTKDYNMSGIAYYTNTHEDIVQEIYSGINQNPSATFLRKLIELHMSARRDLYQNLMSKIKAFIITTENMREN